MQIPPSTQSSVDLPKDIPSRLLSMLADGQSLKAKVIAQLAPELVKIQVADTLLNVRTNQPLAINQQVELQQAIEQGKSVLKLSVPSNVANENSQTASLQNGQRLIVEVIKLLAQNRLLVRPVLVNQAESTKPLALNTPAMSTPARLPAQIEVDITALRENFKLGQQLSLEVTRTQPLEIRLASTAPTRAEWLQTLQRELLPKIEQSSLNLRNLSHVVRNISQAVLNTGNVQGSRSATAHTTMLTEPLQQAVRQLVNVFNDKATLTMPEKLEQAVVNSGPFLESKLRLQAEPMAIRQDVKANLLQLTNTIKDVIQQQSMQPQGSVDAKLMNKLPTEIQLALQQLRQDPQALRQLVSQLQTFLSTPGQTSTPSRLLASLLPAPIQAQQLSNQMATTVNTSRNLHITHQEAVRLLEGQFMRDLLREVEALGARVQANQLAMLKDPDVASNVNVWLFDLPVKDKQQLELMQLKIEQHKAKNNDSDDAIWQVQLNLDTQNLGPVQARIQLHQAQVSVMLIAEWESSVQLLNDNLDHLQRQLEKQDIQVSFLGCQQEKIAPIMPGGVTVADNERLVDVSV